MCIDNLVQNDLHNIHDFSFLEMTYNIMNIQIVAHTNRTMWCTLLTPCQYVGNVFIRCSICVDVAHPTHGEVDVKELMANT